MRKNLLLLSAILLAMLTTSLFAQEVEITKETFGEVAFDANPPANPLYTGSNSSTGFWKLVDSVRHNLTVTTGHWEVGIDSSIRIDNYVVGAGGSTKPWTDTSSSMCLHLCAPTRYGGAWDTAILAGVNVKNYTKLRLEFGWGKRYNGWVSYDQQNRGLNVEYKMDNGDWVEFDTTKLDNPLAGDTWSLGSFTIPVTGDSLSIRFTPYENANQIGIDDVIVYGTPGSSSIKNEQLSNLKIYPIPTADELNVQLAKGVNGTYKIESITGAEVQHGVINNGFEKINVSNLRNGIYLISIISGGSLTTEKFVINK